MMRDSSPPEAILDRGRGSSPALAEMRNSTRSPPRAVKLRGVCDTTKRTVGISRKASSAQILAASSSPARARDALQLIRQLLKGIPLGVHSSLDVLRTFLRTLHRIQLGAGALEVGEHLLLAIAIFFESL